MIERACLIIAALSVLAVVIASSCGDSRSAYEDDPEWKLMRRIELAVHEATQRLENFSDEEIGDENSAHWKSFSDSASGMTFRYHPIWYLRRLKNNTSCSLRLVPDMGSYAAEDIEGRGIWIHWGTLGAITKEEFLAEKVEQYENAPHQSVEIDGREFVRLDYIPQYYGPRITIYYRFEGERFFSASTETFAPDDPKLASFRKLFEGTLRSVEFTSGTPRNSEIIQ